MHVLESHLISATQLLQILSVSEGLREKSAF